MHVLSQFLVRCALACAVAAVAPARPAAAQIAAPTPAALAEEVVRRFASGTPAAFDSVYPFDEGRRYVANAVQNNRERRPGMARVLSPGRDTAVLLLSGYVAFGNPGSETLVSRSFGGPYETVRGPRGWVLSRNLLLDAENRIVRHRAHVTLAPGESARVVDTLDIVVGSANGFAARLHHGARLASVRLDGRRADHLFEGGLLWVRAPRRESSRLELTYTLDPRYPSAPRGGYGPASGFLRDQDVWLPVLNYRTAADMAQVAVSVRIPERFRVATSVPQRETVRAGVREVRGQTIQPSRGVSLAYDTAWQPYEVRADSARLEVFVTPEFQPARAELEAAFRRSYALLRGRFGRPRSDYFAIVQRREVPWTGWSLLSNNAIVTGRNGGPPSRVAGFPSANLAHEMAHAWTTPTGPGGFLMMEGWATFAESYALADEYGPEGERAMWEAHRNYYQNAGYEGRLGILNDVNNEGVAYPKGAYIFRLLRDALGEEVFLRGLRGYMDIPAGQPAGIPEFTAALSRAAGRDVWSMLRPWVEETVIPDVRARVVDGRVALSQAGPVFQLPLELELVTAAGTVRRMVMLDRREMQLDAGDAGPVRDVRVDPDRRLLIQRHRGELAVFEIRLPDAKSVALGGDLAARPIPATLVGDRWRVEVPLAEGLYSWHWTAEGRRVTGAPGGEPVSGTREVRPQVELSSLRAP